MEQIVSYFSTFDFYKPGRMIPKTNSLFEKIRLQTTTLNHWCKIHRCKSNTEIAGNLINPRTAVSFQEDSLFIQISANHVQAVYPYLRHPSFEPMYEISLRASCQLNLEYVFAILNARITQFYIHQLSKTLSVQIPYGPTINHVRQLPVKNIDKENANENHLYLEIVKNADLLLRLNAELEHATTSYKTGLLYTQIAYHQKRINQLTYLLYELKAGEVDIVLGKEK